MKLNAFTLTLAPLLVAGAFSAHAGPQAHVVCAYHHTLGDDAIMMFGKPNQAMWHDFFGNTHTDAVSTYQTLRDQPETTCDNKADGSAYWVPSMKLPDGQVVTPAYQKPTIRPPKWNSIRCTRSRRVSNCWRAITTVRRPARASPFCALTAKATATRPAKSVGCGKVAMRYSLISVFSSPTAGMGSTSNRLTDTVTRHTTSTAPVRATIR